MDYKSIISEKFSNCDVEVIKPDVFDMEMLIEYITDDIIIYNPFSIMCYRHMIRFMMNVGLKGKIYYLEGFSDDDLKLLHEGLLKFASKEDVKINLINDADPDKDILGL